MFKKYFFVLFAFIFGLTFFVSPKASAFVKPNQTASTSVTYNVTAVTANDFNDNIQVLITGAPANTEVDVIAEWTGRAYGSAGKHMTDANGSLITSINRNWTATSALPVTYTLDAYAQATSSMKPSNMAHYTITVNAAPITMTTSPDVTDGSSVNIGSEVSFTCTNSSAMYFGSQSDWGSKQTMESDAGNPDGSGAVNSYTLKHTFTFNDPGDYKVECVNVGGEANSQVKTFTVEPAATGNLSASPMSCTIAAGESTCDTELTWNTENPTETSSITSSQPNANTTVFTGNSGTNQTATVYYGGRTFYLYNNGTELDSVTVAASCASGSSWDASGGTCAANKTYFDITSAASSPNHTGTDNTISWTSTADICNVYNSSKATKIGTGAKSGSNSWSTTIPASYVNSSPGSQTYQIKCYDATDYPASTLTADSDAHTGWQSYSANITTPSCPTGQTWDGSKCVVNAQPSGNLSASPMTCTIAAGDSTCTTEITWSTSNPIGTSAITSSKPTSNTNVATGNSGSNVPETVYYSSRNFFLYNNAQELDSVVVNAVCATGTTWDSSKCAVNKTYFNITGVDSNPNIAGENDTFTWTSTADTCNLYNFDKSGKLSTGVKSGDSSWSTTVSSANIGGYGSKGFYIKCYDATDYPASTLTADTDPHTGWSDKYTVDVVCPNGQVEDDGSCHVTCSESQVYGDGACHDVFTISDINSTPNKSHTDNTFTWTSTADTCQVQDDSGNVLATGSKSGDNWSTTVDGNDIGNNTGTKTFRISCTSNTDYADDSQLTVDPSTPNTGYTDYSVNIIPGDSCPGGSYSYNGSAGVCGNTNVTCQLSGDNLDSVSCTPKFICLDGSNPEVILKDKSGATTSVPMTNYDGHTVTFDWQETTYQYDFTCQPDVDVPVLPVQKTYAHFLSFNLSGSSVKKGTGLNMNWLIEDPNSSCSIVGKSLADGSTVFDTSNSNNPEYALNDYIATSTHGYTGPTKAQADGSYKDVTGNYWTVNQSTRFTASCTQPGGEYKPGTYQIVRDVYVVGENE